MPTLLCIIVALLAFPTFAQAQEAEQAIRPPTTEAGPGGFAGRRAEQRRAWLERTVGVPFAERARGNSWEAEAKGFVAAAFERWVAHSAYENDADLATRGHRLLHGSKCDDPLVLCLAARLDARASYDAFWHRLGISDLMSLYRADWLAALGRIERALEELERAGTPRGFLAGVALEGACLTIDEGRARGLRGRAAGWLQTALSDGSYAIPGPEEELLVADALGEAGWRGLSEWTPELRAAVEASPLSGWARSALLGGWEWGHVSRRRKGGEKGADRTPALALLAESWKLHPTVPEPAGLVFHSASYGRTPDGASLQTWFDRVTAAQFDYFPAWKGAVGEMASMPGSSLDEAALFWRGCVATKRFDTAVPLFFLDGLRKSTFSAPWRTVCRTPENAAALLALGRGMVAEPSRRGELAMWQSLAAVWAWIGGCDREAASALAALPGGALHPAALLELRYFRATPAEMKAELAVRLSPGRADHEKGMALFRELEPAGAGTAFAAALEHLKEEPLARQWVERQRAAADFEVASMRGEWMKVPLDLGLWEVFAGKWSNTADGALVFEGEERPAFAVFRARVGVDWEMRGEYAFAVPAGAPRHPELGIAFRSHAAPPFLQCLTWRDGEELAVGFRRGITSAVNNPVQAFTPDGRAPLREVNRFHFKTDARHCTLDLNGRRIWDNAENRLSNLVGPYGRIGFCAREPGARNLSTVRSLEIRRLPSTLGVEPKRPLQE